MSEQETQKRGPHRWQPGQSGNPRGGRPRTRNALAAMLRDGVENSAIVEKTKALLASNNESIALQAMQFYAQYSGQKPSEKFEVGPPDHEDEDLSHLHLTDEQLKRLEELEAERVAIISGARILDVGAA